MSENELTVYEPTHDIAITKEPDIVLSEARKAAKALTNVIDSRKKKLIMGGKTYLFNEDWQTVGKFYGVYAKIRTTRYVEYGNALGFEAEAEAIRADGMVISAAEAMCLNDERNWTSKPLFQLKSMAQTRACSKALKNVLAWVVVLAGYEPTPAEEMTGNEKQSQQKTSEKPQLTEEQSRLWVCLVNYCGSDKAVISAELKTRTAFTVTKGKDKGKQIEGKDSIYEVSDSQAKTVRHQIEAELKKKEQKTAEAPIEPEVLPPKTSQLDYSQKCVGCWTFDNCMNKGIKTASDLCERWKDIPDESSEMEDF